MPDEPARHPRSRYPPHSDGFSFIEAVVAVSVVGMMAAFALPRFTRAAIRDGGAQHQSSLCGRSGARSYVASGARLSSATVEGKTVNLKNGYLDTSSSGIGNAAFESDGFNMKASGDVVVFSNSDAPSENQCSVTYHAASAASDAATITNLNPRGC